MNLTLKQVRDNLFQAVVPDLASQANINKFNTYLNWAVERLINSGSWIGMVQPVIFDTTTDLDPCVRHITLPGQFISVLAMRYTQRCGADGCGNQAFSSTPAIIRNQWFSYTNPGPYCYNWNFAYWPQWGFGPWNNYSQDLGDGFVTFRDSPYLNYKLKITLENIEDSGSIVLIKGFDADGQRIFTPSSSSAYEGVEAQISYPSTTIDQVFSRQIYFFGKPASQGYFYLDAVDEATGASTRIGQYWPSEVNPSYHRYQVTKCQGCPSTHVEALCKLAYFPITADTDTVVPNNLGALRLMLAALVYESNSDFGRYEDNYQRAIKLLNDETRSERGGAEFKLRVATDSFRMQGLYPGR